jgi:hypothetical protein
MVQIIPAMTLRAGFPMQIKHMQILQLCEAPPVTWRASSGRRSTPIGFSFSGGTTA